MVLFLLGAFLAKDALAQQRSFERLPDGHIYVEIFGQQIALPGSDLDLDGIRFYPRQASRLSKPFFSLREALADPAKARTTLDTEQNSVNVQIIVDHPSQPSILGRYARGDAPLEPLSIQVNRAAQPNSVRGQLPRRSERWPPEASAPDEDGYFVRQGPVSSNAIEPMDISYRLPAAMRLWKTNVDLIVICTLTGAPVRHCGEHLATADGRISVGWSWHDRKVDVAPRLKPYTFPKSAWKALDLRLHEVTEHLLLNRPSGGME